MAFCWLRGEEPWGGEQRQYLEKVMPSLTIFGSKLVQRYLGLGANGKSGRRDDEVVEQYLLIWAGGGKSGAKTKWQCWTIFAGRLSWSAACVVLTISGHEQLGVMLIRVFFHFDWYPSQRGGWQGWVGCWQGADAHHGGGWWWILMSIAQWWANPSLVWMDGWPGGPRDGCG